MAELLSMADLSAVVGGYVLDPERNRGPIRGRDPGHSRCPLIALPGRIQMLRVDRVTLDGRAISDAQRCSYPA